MTEKDFMANFNNIFQFKNTINMDDKLDDIDEWDSLSTMTFIARFSKLCEKGLVFSDVKAAYTIRDLYNVVK